PTTAGGGLMGQEAAQPPLYYTLAALVIRAVPDSTLTPAGLWPNPMADAADPRGESLARPPINVNLFVHGPAEAWPWGGYALAVHLVRIMSTIMGLGTLLCLYGAGRAVWPEAPSRALLATALVACLPQFAFIHAAVSNDPAITLFSAAALWQLLRIRNYESGIRAGERARRVAYGALGVIVGLAMLSKAAGLLLLVWCGAAAALLA
ncbi:MAG TPA: glycosyltransferase family 39 protein, partial [Promineifilum sp.]|nr:glycosyltransferase family 39 protein [Promineifilum sp.]